MVVEKKLNGGFKRRRKGGDVRRKRPKLENRSKEVTPCES